MALTMMTSQSAARLPASRPPARRPGAHRAARPWTSRPAIGHAMAAPPRASVPDEVIWVYAITDSLRPGQLDGVTGVGREPVRAVTAAGLNAVVGSVDARSFGEQALASLLGGLDNIARVGRAHHRVIERAAAGGPVLPLRLATLHPDDTTVRALLGSRRGEFAELLEKFRHRVEWGVQIYARPGDPEAVAGAEAAADLIDVALSDVAVSARRQPAEDPQFADRGEWMALNAAYLLDADRAAGFTAVLHGLTSRQAGMRAELNGPWPPYSFVDGLEA